MQKDRQERKDVYGRTGVVVRRNVTFLVYKCPKRPACSQIYAAWAIIVQNMNRPKKPRNGKLYTAVHKRVKNEGASPILVRTVR